MSKGSKWKWWRMEEDERPSGRWRAEVEGEERVKNEKARVKERGGCLGSILNHYSEDTLSERWNHAWRQRGPPCA